MCPCTSCVASKVFQEEDFDCNRGIKCSCHVMPTVLQVALQLSGSWEVVPCPFVSLHLRVRLEDVTASPSDGGRLFTATTGQVTVTTLYQTAIHLPYTPICYVHRELILDDLWLCTSVCGSKVFQQELSFDRGQ